MHFGKTLKKLRQSRGFSLEALGHAAGITGNTIHRAEKRSDCTLRPSNVLAITAALQSGTPFTPDEAEQWSAATGLDSSWRIHREIERLPSSHPSASTLHMAQAMRRMGPARATCHQWITEIIDGVGELRVMELLKGLASYSGVELSPPYRAQDLQEGEQR